MTPTLKISKMLLNKLSTNCEPCSGKLFGIFLENTIVLIGLQLDIHAHNSLEFSFPTEVDPFGLFIVGTSKNTNVAKKLNQIDVTDNPVYLNSILDKKGNQILNYLMINGKLENQTYTPISEQEIYEQYIHVRLRCQFKLTCYADKDSVRESLGQLKNLVSSGKVAFNFPKTKVYLMGSESEIENSLIGITGEPNLGEMCVDSTEINESGKKRKNENFELNILNINMFQNVTREDLHAVKNHAPICIISKKEMKTLNIPVIIDSVALIHKQTKVNKLYEILVESVIRNITSYQNTLINLFSEHKEPRKIVPYHFYPTNCGHFVSVWFVENVNSKESETGRKLLHKQLMLGLKRPLFRKGNQYIFKSDIIEQGPLINPHESLKTSLDGTVALVQGRYRYYHYCQNKMDDNGWGCAYRSLQTLASWFKLQGYVDREVPTFDEIQKCLVDIGDKPSSFMGSRQWIGSTEVNFVLNTLLGVTCKILYVSSGEEMKYKGPELVRHFEEYGSPIMIGGGVLAHTILGVNYDAATDNIKFLILDPHYTGSEDLGTILNKGWCGWKNVDFWNKTSYYNMCLPLVPTEI